MQNEVLPVDDRQINPSSGQRAAELAV